MLVDTSIFLCIITEFFFLQECMYTARNQAGLFVIRCCHSSAVRGNLKTFIQRAELMFTSRTNKRERCRVGEKSDYGSVESK